jgi:hypothetical protein
LAVELRGRTYDIRITLGPIESVACVRANLAALNNQLSPVALVLDLVNPFLALGRSINESCELRFEKAKSGV